MNLGEVPRDWRQRRSIVRVVVEPDNGCLLDVEDLDSRIALEPYVHQLMVALGIADLDVAVVRGADRRITRAISQFAYDATFEDGSPCFDGIRYSSRLSSEWECWAVFERTKLRPIERRPVMREDEALGRVARTYGLKIF